MNGDGITTPASIKVLSWSRRQLWLFAGLMLLANFAAPGSMLAESIVTGEPYWRLYRGEDNAVEWFSSLQMVIVALVAYANHQLAVVARGMGRDDTPRFPAVWPLFALGFVFLALDERFDIHELLRDDVFRPAGFFTEVDWIIAGDVGLYLFFVVGLIGSVFLLDELRRSPHALALFVAALVLVFPAVVIDSLRDATMAGWPLRRFLDYAFEEVAEIWAQLLFLLAFLAVLAGRLERLESHEAAAS